MTTKQLDEIRVELEHNRTIKHSIAAAKAQCELDALMREREAYLNGIYDAFRRVEEQIEREQITEDNQ